MLSHNKLTWTNHWPPDLAIASHMCIMNNDNNIITNPYADIFSSSVIYQLKLVDVITSHIKRLQLHVHVVSDDVTWEWNAIPRLIYMMTSSNGNIFRVTDPLCGEFTGHRWIPRKKASDAELEQKFKDTLHPAHMRQPVVAVGTKHCQPVDAVDTKGCCCNTCFGRFHPLLYPQHRISKGVPDYLSEVSQSSKAEWWIYFVLWLGLWEFRPCPQRVIKYNTRGPFTTVD